MPGITAFGPLQTTELDIGEHHEHVFAAIS
jgi:hypothetical protein